MLDRCAASRRASIFAPHMNVESPIKANLPSGEWRVKELFGQATHKFWYSQSPACREMRLILELKTIVNQLVIKILRRAYSRVFSTHTSRRVVQFKRSFSAFHFYSTLNVCGDLKWDVGGGVYVFTDDEIEANGLIILIVLPSQLITLIKRLHFGKSSPRYYLYSI